MIDAQYMELYRKLQAEVDMLKGNINRMCVTDEKNELDSMRDYAKLRIDSIYELRQAQIERHIPE